MYYIQLDPCCAVHKEGERRKEKKGGWGDIRDNSRLSVLL